MSPAFPAPYDRTKTFASEELTMIRIAGAAKIILAAVAGIAPLMWTDTAHAADGPTEVMIVGVIHTAYPGLDRYGSLVPDVLLPQYQAELVRMTEGLARFRPMQVHVESEDEVAADYARYLAGELQSRRNEIVQVGFRLAKHVGLATLHASDTSDSRDIADSGPIEAFVAAHGKKALLDELIAKGKALREAQNEILRTGGLLALLRHTNHPDNILFGHVAERTLLIFGAGKEQPGADYWAKWNRRNIIICAKIIQAARPGDRLAVFFGDAHSYLLRQCVSETPGFKLIEANDYLPK